MGPSNYGIINYGASIISFFMIISRLGLDGVIINEMIKNPARQGGFLGSALLMRLITSIFSLFMIVTLVRVLEPENNSLSLVTFLQAFAVILQGYEVLTYWFQLQLKMKYVAIATMIGLTVSAVWRILLLSTGASLYFFALSYSIQYAVCFLLIFILFTKDTKRVICLSWNKKDAWHLLKNSYHFIISGIAVTLYMQIDKIMIGKILNSTEVGIYTAASTVAALWEFVPNALINSARPLILEERMKNYDNYIKKYQQLLLGITIMFVVVSCSLVLCGKWVVLVLYGNNYMEAVIPLGILVWSTGFSMIGSARGIWTIGEGLNRYMKYIVFIGAGINLVLNFFLYVYGELLVLLLLH